MLNWSREVKKPVNIADRCSSSNNLTLTPEQLKVYKIFQSEQKSLSKNVGAAQCCCKHESADIFWSESLKEHKLQFCQHEGYFITVINFQYIEQNQQSENYLFKFS